LSRVDLRAALGSALDVPIPPPPLHALRMRGALQRARNARHRVRSLLAAATLIVVAALLAGGLAPAAATPSQLAASPAPAPIPLAT
jgi:hypothetical protein